MGVRATCAAQVCRFSQVCECPADIATTSVSFGDELRDRGEGAEEGGMEGVEEERVILAREDAVDIMNGLEGWDAELYTGDNDDNSETKDACYVKHSMDVHAKSSFTTAPAAANFQYSTSLRSRHRKGAANMGATRDCNATRHVTVSGETQRAYLLRTRSV